MDTLIKKLSSRKFWMALAAFLGSIGGTCAGMATGNESLATAGMICTALSAAIYMAAEAYVDAANVSSNITSVAVTTTSKEIAASALGANTSVTD